MKIIENKVFTYEEAGEQFSSIIEAENGYFENALRPLILYRGGFNLEHIKENLDLLLEELNMLKDVLNKRNKQNQ